MLFERLSKFNKLLYSFKGNPFDVSFALRYVASRFAGILLKANGLWVVWIAAILLPCLIDIGFLFGGEVASIDLKGLQMTVEVSKKQSLVNIIGSITPSDLGVVFQKNKFRKKSISEFSSSFIEILLPTAAFAEEMGKPSTEERPDNAEQKTDDEILHSDLLLLLVGYVMGLLYIHWDAHLLSFAYINL
jgi:hypothetical protein